MSKYHIGDTFKIEVAEVFQGAESGNDKYRIKGFDNLVFDEKGLNRLEPIKVDTGVERRYKLGDVVYFNGESYLVLWESPEYGSLTLVDKDKAITKWKKSIVDFEKSIPDYLVIAYLNDEVTWLRIAEEITLGA